MYSYFRSSISKQISSVIIYLALHFRIGIITLLVIYGKQFWESKKPCNSTACRFQLGLPFNPTESRFSVLWPALTGCVASTFSAVRAGVSSRIGAWVTSSESEGRSNSWARNTLCNWLNSCFFTASNASSRRSNC